MKDPQSEIKSHSFVSFSREVFLMKCRHGVVRGCLQDPIWNVESQDFPESPQDMTHYNLDCSTLTRFIKMFLSFLHKVDNNSQP